MQKQPHQDIIPFGTAVHFLQQWEGDLSSSTVQNIHQKSIHGRSELKFTDGGVYQGQMKHGKFNGSGVYTWVDGLRYEGSFKDNMLTGQGRILWPNGSCYEGQVLKGLRHGQGTYSCSINKCTYTGQWRNGKKEGRGKIVYSDNSVYDGQFRNDRKHGRGRLTYPSKNYYEGEWKQDQKNGKGTMRWATKNQKYIGEWKDNCFDGYGEYYWYENKTEFKTIKNFFKGYWCQGHRHGYGVQFYSNGCRFEGYFCQDSKQGVGLYINQSGDFKVERFVNNRQVRLQQLSGSAFTSQDGNQKQNQLAKLPKISIKNYQQSLPSQPKPQYQNQYYKYIDFKHHEIDDTFFNMLLRNNSVLRDLYKAASNPTSNCSDFYSGMVLQNYWRVLSESGLLGQVPLAWINRHFIKGKKSYFSFNFPMEAVLQYFKNEENSVKIDSYQNILWQGYYSELRKGVKMLQETKKSQQAQTKAPKHIRNQQIDIHNGSNIILFRHFVCLVVHTAMLAQTSRKSLRTRVENVINSLSAWSQSNSGSKNDKNVEGSQSKPVPQWARNLIESGVTRLKLGYQNFDNRKDMTISVRKMAYLLQRANIITNSFERGAFVQRLTKSLHLKQDIKAINPNEHRSLSDMPQYSDLLNFQLTTKQFIQQLFSTISNKIGATTQQELKQKYTQAIEQIVEAGQSTLAARLAPKCRLKTKQVRSEKDNRKNVLILEFLLEKERKIMEEKDREEKMREKRQRNLMQRQDYDAE